MAKVLIKDHVTNEVFEASLETAKILTNYSEFLKLIKSMHSNLTLHQDVGIMGKINNYYTYTTDEGTFSLDSVKKGVYAIIPNTSAAKVLYGGS